MESHTNSGFSSVRLIAVLFGTLCAGLAPQVGIAQVSCVAPPPSLASWWRGEGDGADAAWANPALLVNGAGFTSGYVGQAFFLDGAASYLRVPASGSLDVGQAAGLTLEAWVNVVDAGNGHSLFEWSGITGGPPFGVHLWIGHPSHLPGYIFANLVDAGGGFHTIETADGVMAAGVFQHIALTYDKASGLARLFLNGVVVAEQNLGVFTPQTAGDLCLGSRGGGSYFFSGLIDEPSVYARALSPEEVGFLLQAGAAGKCPNPSGPAVITEPTDQYAYKGDAVTLRAAVSGAPTLSYRWYFNYEPVDGGTNSVLTLANIQLSQAGSYFLMASNASGVAYTREALVSVVVAPPCQSPPAALISLWRGDGDARDSVGANHGLAVNNPAYALAKVRSGFVFNGIDQYVEIPQAATLSPPTNLTVEAWVYLSGYAGSAMPVVAKDDGGTSREYQLGVTGAAGQPVASAQVRVPAGYVSLTGASQLALGTWNHIAMTYDGAALCLYVNGLADTNTAATGLLVKTAQPVRVGRSGTSFFAGVIDELALYGRALSAAEILANVSAGDGGKCMEPVAPFFLLQPTNRSVLLGNSTTFSALAAGSTALQYQWRRDGTDVPGATTGTLVVPNAQFAQTGAYTVVVSNSVGSITSSPALLTLTFPQAVVRLPNATVSGGAAFSLPVLLTANGVENALAFSLSFDPAKVTCTGVAPGSAAAGAMLMVNYSQTNGGKVGIAIALPPAATFAWGTQQVAVVRFVAGVLTNATSASISFGDQPTQRQLLDGRFGTLAVVYSGATVSVLSTEFEGDVYPRANGDKNVMFTDWLLLGRYVARLDFPTNTAELVRADCAPRSSLGNGAITVADWAQAARCAFGFDTWAVAGGPTNEVAAPDAGPSGTRRITAGTTPLAPAEPCAVDLTLAADGNENAVGFSLSFDSARVVFTGASLGAGAGGAVLYVNANQALVGRLGIVLALPAGASFAPGIVDLVRLGFTAASGATGNFSPTFADQPVPREVCDVMAAALPVSYINEAVPSGPPPVLRITRVESTITLAWPSSASNFQLHVASDLPGASGWTNLNVVPMVINSERTVTLPLGAEPRFYRLISQ